MIQNSVIPRLTDNSFLTQFGKYFRSNSFLTKFNNAAEKIGKEVAEKALALYYVIMSKGIPLKIRLRIAGALGYFILPHDLMPDFIVGLGFTDDIIALCFVYDQIQAYRTPEIDKKVETKIRELFG